MSRDEVFKELDKNGIVARKYFYPITSSFDCYKDKFTPEKTPIALSISQKVLTLPLYADLDLTIVDKISQIIMNMKK